MADAAYDADRLRQFIANDLGAMAQIKQTPTRKNAQQIDWTLYKERHLVEGFFNIPLIAANSNCRAVDQALPPDRTDM